MPSAPSGRSAVIFYGLLQRSLQYTAPSIRKNLITPLQGLGTADVFYHSWEIEQIDNLRTGERGSVLSRQEVSRLLPNAQGVFESQSDFDQSKDWGVLFENNMMRDCTDSEESALVALMNLFRALESLQRAWSFFCENKNHHYDRVIITRADLNFLSSLPLPSMEDKLLIPAFHGWGGVNDRFVMGEEAQLAIYAQRVQFAENWNKSNHSGNSEQLLKSWLDQNHIAVQPFEYYFLRVRANGKIADHDNLLFQHLLSANKVPGATIRMNANPSHKLSEKGKLKLQQFRAICKNSIQKATKDRFLILTRHAGPAALNLQRIFEPLGKTEVIVDHPEACSKGIWYADEEIQGYENLMGSKGFPALTAWSRAFFHLEKTLEEDENIWLIEDDVAGPAAAFQALVHLCHKRQPDFATSKYMSPQSHPDWYWWARNPNPDWFAQPRGSFNPLCRLSARLVREVLALRKNKEQFTFHEILFASLAFQEGMSVIDWLEDDEFRSLIGTFNWRPEIRRAELSICHPVKDAYLHTLISKVEDGRS